MQHYISFALKVQRQITVVIDILGGEDGRASSNVADNKRNSEREEGDMVIIGCVVL